MVFTMCRVLLEECTGLCGVWLMASSSSGMVCGKVRVLWIGYCYIEVKSCSESVRSVTKRWAS